MNRHEGFQERAGPDPRRRRIATTPLSRAAQEARRPLPPEYLVDALHDTVHREVGRGRAVRPVRSKPESESEDE